MISIIESRYRAGIFQIRVCLSFLKIYRLTKININRAAIGIFKKNILLRFSQKSAGDNIVAAPEP
jgi:hypothetical protein